MPGDFIYTHCLHLLILYSSLKLFHRDCSCCSSHVDKFDGYFFFFIELFSSSSTIHYHHHHSFLKQSPLSHVQYTELCVTSWIFSVSFFCSIFSTKSLNLGVPPNQHRTSFLSYLHILPMFL